MAGFLYYLPAVTPDQVNPEFVRIEFPGLRTSLRDLLQKWQPSHNVAVVSTPRGPDGNAGVLLYPFPVNVPAAEQASVAHKPDQQEWRDCGSYWLGVWTDDRPGPADLQRPSQVNALPVELGDGRDWDAPVVRAAPDVSGLPSRWDVDAAGELVESTVEHYQWAWELSGRAWDIHQAGESVSKPEVFQIAAQFLSVNYRVGVRECGFLGLIGREAAEVIICVAIAGELKDLMSASESTLKKTADELPLSNSSPGETAPSPVTGQPA